MLTNLTNNRVKINFQNDCQNYAICVKFLNIGIIITKILFYTHEGTIKI